MLRADYRAARQAELLQKWLATDPSLEHRAELAALLLPTGDARAAA
jgi:hypothetical protein